MVTKEQFNIALQLDIEVFKLGYSDGQTGKPPSETLDFLQDNYFTAFKNIIEIWKDKDNNNIILDVIISVYKLGYLHGLCGKNLKEGLEIVKSNHYKSLEEAKTILKNGKKTKLLG